MKRRGYAIAVLAVVILITGCLWLLRGPEASEPRGALAFVSYSTNQIPRHATFRFHNDGSRALFLSWMLVEAKTSRGWRVIEKKDPPDPRGVDGGKSTDLVVSVPAQVDRWRLRVVYGRENRGPVLLLTRVELAIRKRSISGWRSVGVFTGSNSASAELSQ